jgi:hypothetical protein
MATIEATANSQESQTQVEDYVENVKAEQEYVQASQEELLEGLTCKLKKFFNVKVNSKELSNEQGKYYRIFVNVRLQGLFYSATIDTVSHFGRIVNIKCIFADNKQVTDDMLVNADAIIQIFRNVDTKLIDTVTLKSITDQHGNAHLCVLAKTFKNKPSLIYTYRKMMEFVQIMGEKYVSSPPASVHGVLPSTASVPVPVGVHGPNMQSVPNMFHGKQQSSPFRMPMASAHAVPSNLIGVLNAEEQYYMQQLEFIKAMKISQQQFAQMSMSSVYANSAAAIAVPVANPTPSPTPSPTPFVKKNFKVKVSEESRNIYNKRVNRKLNSDVPAVAPAAVPEPVETAPEHVVTDTPTSAK